MFSHGTLLLDSDLDDVTAALWPTPGKIESKGLESVRSRESKYGTWAWNDGQNPACNVQRARRFSGGEIDVRLDIQQGRIAGCASSGTSWGAPTCACSRQDSGKSTGISENLMHGHFLHIYVDE